MPEQIQTLREYLQTRIEGTYEARPINRYFITDTFSITDLPLGITSHRIEEEIEQYYVGRGMKKSFGRSYDLNFEGGEEVLGLTLRFNPITRFARITVNDAKKASLSMS